MLIDKRDNPFIDARARVCPRGHDGPFGCFQSGGGILSTNCLGRRPRDGGGGGAAAVLHRDLGLLT